LSSLFSLSLSSLLSEILLVGLALSPPVDPLGNAPSSLRGGHHCSLFSSLLFSLRFIDTLVAESSYDSSLVVLNQSLATSSSLTGLTPYTPAMSTHEYPIRR
jgi:hypothetical protein